MLNDGTEVKDHLLYRNIARFRWRLLSPGIKFQATYFQAINTLEHEVPDTWFGNISFEENLKHSCLDTGDYINVWLK
jgi:hypothetical protein